MKVKAIKDSNGNRQFETDEIGLLNKDNDKIHLVKYKRNEVKLIK